MALKKYYLNTSADTTNTIKGSAEGLLFNYFFYNLGTTDGTIKFYLEDSDGNDIILYDDTVSKNQKIFFKEKISLEGEDVKVYSSIDDIQVVIQILN